MDSRVTESVKVRKSPEDLVFIRGTWSVKTFVFVVSFFSFLSHRKHRTVKGGRGNTKENFPSDAHLKAYT